MARLPRIEGESLVYYIVSRGRNNQKIFQDEEDRQYFVNLLKQQKIRGKLTFYGYVLLPGQYAILLETNKKNLCHCMHLINSHYVNFYNRRHNRRSKLFRDRYKCFIIDKKNHLAEVSRYLHSLPKKEEATDSLIRYEWSSFPGYIRKAKREDWIEYGCILKQFEQDDQSSALAYKKYVNQSSGERTSSPFENLGARNILGSGNFRREIYKKQLSSRGGSQSDEKEMAEKIIDLVNQNSGWTSLKNRKRKSRIKPANLSRNAAIYFLKRYTELDNQQINGFFKSLQKSSVSQMSRRFNLAREKNKAIAKISDSLDKEIKSLVLNVDKKEQEEKRMI